MCDRVRSMSSWRTYAALPPRMGLMAGGASAAGPLGDWVGGAGAAAAGTAAGGGAAAAAAVAAEELELEPR